MTKPRGKISVSGHAKPSNGQSKPANGTDMGEVVSPATTEKSPEKSYVEVIGDELRGKYHDDIAWILYTYEVLVGLDDKPIIIRPDRSWSTGDRLFYEKRLAAGTRIEIMAVIFGVTADQLRREQEKILFSKLRRIPPPAKEPEILKPPRCRESK